MPHSMKHFDYGNPAKPTRKIADPERLIGDQLSFIHRAIAAIGVDSSGQFDSVCV